jgi:hypothetical protein
MTDEYAKLELAAVVHNAKLAGAWHPSVSLEVLAHCLLALDDRAALVAVAEASDWWSAALDAARRHMEGKP